MSYICEHCGAHLDPGEKCDCIAESEELRKRWESMIRTGKDGQQTFRLEKEEPAWTRNTTR